MTHRIVLSPRVTRREFEDIAFGSGWRLHEVVEAAEEHPYEEIWSVDNGRSAVHYIEDGLLGLLYVIVLGEHVDELEASLRRALETVRPADALEWLDDAASAERRVQAAAYLAASAEHPAPDLIEAFDRLMRDPVADVRRAAIFAATYPAWPELLPLVQNVARDDADAGVRDAAQEIAQILARHRGHSGEFLEEGGAT
ncbi:MAG TPA: hypothetical protein VGF54_11910 [Streptosporangiaceae bacterium]|jgi:hypothetical protein